MVQPKNEKYKLQCEWASCRDIHDNMDEFYKHLDQHFWTDVANVPLEPGCTLVCQWCDCNFVTTNGHDLIRHLYFHGFHTKLKWLGFLKCEEAKCGECQVNQNRNIIPELPDGFKCCWEECFVVVDIPDKFYDHVRDHAGMADPEGDSKKVFKCHWEGCNYEYKVDDNKPLSHGRHKLRGHMNTHTQERGYACPWCGNLYVNKTKLIDHYTRQTNAEYHTFQCTHCSRTFASERILKDHMRHHVNHYQCPKCAMTCPNPSALKHHIRYKHSNERPFACEFCEYRSKERHDLHRHMQFHQSDLSYHCQVEGCDYVVRSIQNLRYHYRVKHASGDGKQYACHLCDTKYATGYQLTHHLGKTHNFQWPPGHCRFRYNECEDGFFRLQIFRYESMELTQQLMNNEATKTTVSDAPSTSASTTSPGKPITRLNVARRKKADAARKLALEKNAGNTRKLRKGKTKATVTNSKKKSTKRKSSAVSPKVKQTRSTTVISPKEKSVAVFNENSHLPDLYIESGECLEAADALCSMKTNSAKKKNLENQRTASMLELECHRTESRDSFLDEMCANAVDIDSDDSIELDIHDFQPTPLRNMNTRNVGGTTRSSSSKKSPSAVTSPSKRFARARKRLKLTGSTTEKNTRTSIPSKSSVSRASTADKNFKDRSVGVTFTNAPVFPDHHKLYCSQAPKSVTTLALCKNRYRISPRKQVAPKKNVVGDKVHQNEVTGALVQELTELPNATAQGFESEISVDSQNDVTLPQIHEKECEIDGRNMLGTENQDSAPILNKLDSNKLVEVNGSKVVLDEAGNRTVVSVGGEDFYLVSGTHTDNGGTVYCLVKATEFTEVEK